MAANGAAWPANQQIIGSPLAAPYNNSIAGELIIGSLFSDGLQPKSTQQPRPESYL